MTPAKQVSFIEKVDKSQLGLDGLQVVVYSDRCRDKNAKNIINNEYNFSKIGKQMLKEVNGEYISKLYHLKEGVEFGKRLHQERVSWMRERRTNEKC